MDTWASITAGRQAFAEYLAALSPQDWSTPSLCASWTVKDVASHMLVIPTIAKGQVFRAFLRSGFNLDKMNARFVKTIAAEKSPAEIAAATRSSAGSRSMPPGLKLPGVLNELAVHTSDISEALGKPFALPLEVYVASLEHLKGVQPVFGSKKRIAGLALRATDTSWTTGTGPSVEGPAQQLLAAVAGRRSAIDALSGDGVEILRSRTS